MSWDIRTYLFLQATLGRFKERIYGRTDYSVLYFYGKNLIFRKRDDGKISPGVPPSSFTSRLQQCLYKAATFHQPTFMCLSTDIIYKLSYTSTQPLSRLDYTAVEEASTQRLSVDSQQWEGTALLFFSNVTLLTLPH